VEAGDLTGDVAVEIVGARNPDENDVHYTSAVVAQRLDGSVLWRRGGPGGGRRSDSRHDPLKLSIRGWGWPRDSINKARRSPQAWQDVKPFRQFSHRFAACLGSILASGRHEKAPRRLIEGR